MQSLSVMENQNGPKTLPVEYFLNSYTSCQAEEVAMMYPGMAQYIKNHALTKPPDVSCEEAREGTKKLLERLGAAEGKNGEEMVAARAISQTAFSRMLWDLYIDPASGQYVLPFTEWGSHQINSN